MLRASQPASQPGQPASRGSGHAGGHQAIRMDSKAKVLLLIRNNELQGRRQEKGEGKEADEEGRMNELTVEVQPGHQANRKDS